MPITPAQKTAIEEVIEVITTAKAKDKRVLCQVFLELVDRNEWPQYYEVIPQPKCINNIRKSFERNRYKDPLSVYTDLSLVFWNALYYNEESSQIALDAKVLKQILETEWKKRSGLPSARTSPPPGSAQKAHQLANDASLGPGPSSINEQDVIADTNSQASDLDIEEPPPEAEADTQGQEIVKQLEKSLERWPGFGEQGWATDLKMSQCLDIVHALKNHKDSAGNRLSVALESIPEQSSKAALTSTSSISFKLIETRARHSQYPSVKSFDMDMSRLFEKGRRWYDPMTEPYERVLLLQRLYQSLTSVNPPDGPPYTSKNNFASLPAGPGSVKSIHDGDMDIDHSGIAGVTSNSPAKDKTTTEELHYKGWHVKVGDWLHLSNPDDPSRPIIAQVFQCWISDHSKKKNSGISVCWYYRPEQTFHLFDRKFWGGEVFKTNHFAEHPVEDIIEKVAVQFTARHVRGRPRPPYWYPGWPLYVCDSQYNDRDRTFDKITDWKACIPEEVRNTSEYMSIFPFERAVFPNRAASPFLGSPGKKLPGGLLGAPGQKIKTELDSTAASVAKVTGGSTATAALSSKPTISYSTVTTSSPAATLQTTRVSSTVDRSIVTAVTTAAPGATYRVERLPPETTKHFDRDPETDEVLWFTGPPVDFARPVAPKYSVEYLHFLAKKRKKETSVDGSSTKKARLPTVTETLETIFKHA